MGQQYVHAHINFRLAWLTVDVVWKQESVTKKRNKSNEKQRRQRDSQGEPVKYLLSKVRGGEGRMHGQRC